jgi:hypothetical protein
MSVGMSQPLPERYGEQIAGVLSCYDRLVITGTLPGICYADGMTRFLHASGIRIFDYPQFALKLRDRVRERAASLAAEAGVTIQNIGKAHIRKEDVVTRVLEQRGDHPGPVHVISAMEARDAYQPWPDKRTHQTFVRPAGQIAAEDPVAAGHVPRRLQRAQHLGCIVASRHDNAVPLPRGRDRGPRP